MFVNSLTGYSVFVTSESIFMMLSQSLVDTHKAREHLSHSKAPICTMPPEVEPRDALAFLFRFSRASKYKKPGMCLMEETRV